ncbi:MAG: protein-L-isoaspartate(D-aspartate) O-methyltransferase [Deltaproteobacteria bacterium]|nr:protein-L-isoaspartate(D-aspartate) O-methyltransferase [Deltaproteobacteria bacterium]
MNHDYKHARERMIKTQLIPKGIKDKLVLEAMSKVHRHLFLEEALAGEAYNDHPVPIGHKQTISQPYIVALMTQILKLTGKEKTLEIGTGSGYQTAILAELSLKVYTIERIRPLMEKARYLLNSLDYTNILFKYYDGTLGWQEYAPYNAIIVTAGAPQIPEKLVEQLAEGGRMVIPVGGKTNQDLIEVIRLKTGYKTVRHGGCRFVDLIGAHGWKE